MLWQVVGFASHAGPRAGGLSGTEGNRCARISAARTRAPLSTTAFCSCFSSPPALLPDGSNPPQVSPEYSKTFPGPDSPCSPCPPAVPWEKSDRRRCSAPFAGRNFLVTHHPLQNDRAIGSSLQHALQPRFLQHRAHAAGLIIDHQHQRTSRDTRAALCPRFRPP